jgi:hypothetical protein
MPKIAGECVMSKMLRRKNGSWLTGDLILPKHQDKIVLHLAKKGAMTMSETNRQIKGENTSTTRAFHELERKEMVKQVGKIVYHGREFVKYWLAGRGIAYAFLHDINPELVTGNARCLNDKKIELYLQLHKISHKIGNLLDYQLFYNGTMDFQDIASSVVSEFEENEALQFLNLVGVTPELHEELKRKSENLKHFLEKVEEITKR